MGLSSWIGTAYHVFPSFDTATFKGVVRVYFADHAADAVAIVGLIMPVEADAVITENTKIRPSIFC